MGIQLRPSYDSGYVKMFKFYGIPLSNMGNQYVGDCPFTGCENPSSHLFVNGSTGLWDCKRCGRKGNSYEFIRQFHEDCFNQTTEDDYHRLAEHRKGISPSTFQKHELAYNPQTNEWLIPAWSAKGNMVNLYAWKQVATSDGPHMQIMSGPTFKQVLYGLHTYHKEKDRPLWLIEGHWDWLAFWEVMSKLNDSTKLKPMLECNDILACPGASIWPDEDLPLLSFRDLVFCGDNDAAGQGCVSSCLQKLGRHSITPHSIQQLTFSPGSKQGYDVRDIINDAADPVAAITKIYSSLQSVKIDITKYSNENYNGQAVRPIPCSNYPDLVDVLARPDNTGYSLYFPDCYKDIVAVALAVAATVNIGGKPIWCYIVGPASSGKTTFVELLSTATDRCFAMSKFTGLLSGFTKPGMGDASLLPKLNNKCVIIKDFTTLLSMPEQTLVNVWGELRDIYDGNTAAYYRNFESRQFSNIKFNLLACVTDKIRMYNNTDVGERFIQMEIDSYYHPDGTMIRDNIDKRVLSHRAMMNVFNEISSPMSTKDHLTEQKATTHGFLEHLIERVEKDKTWVQTHAKAVENDTEILDYIFNLSQWTACARSIVNRDRDKSLSYRPRVEYGQRLAIILSKVMIGLCMVLEEEPRSERVLGIIRKLALDTGASFQQEIMMALAHNPDGLTASDVARVINLSDTAAMNKLKDLQELGVVKYSTPVRRFVGNQPHIFSLGDDLTPVATALGFMKG